VLASGWEAPPFNVNNNYFNPDGSLSLEIKISAYMKLEKEAKTIVDNNGVAGGGVKEEGDATKAHRSFGGERRLLDKVAGLLGDKETSDVSISVVNREDEDIKTFYCHSIMLSGEEDN